MQEEVEVFSFWHKFQRKVRGFDSFGIPVQLNFNKQATHNTVFGGVCSLAISLVLLTIVYSEIFKIFFELNFD